jgi:RNA polymerase sigma factor (sigma-70 family)
MSDHEYLEGIRHDDPAVLEAFYENYKDVVRGVVYKYDSSKEIQFDDHYHDVMVIVWNKIRTGELNDLTARLSTFVYSVAYNLLLYKLRKTGKTVPLEGFDVAVESKSVNLDRLEMLALELLDRLRPPCSEILVDWYINRLNYEQIAEKHKYKNENTAKKKKGDCLSQVRAAAAHLLKSKEF